MHLAKEHFGGDMPTLNNEPVPTKSTEKSNAEPMDINNNQSKHSNYAEPIQTVSESNLVGRPFSRHNKRGNRNHHRNRQNANPSISPHYTSDNNYVGQPEARFKSEYNWKRAREDLMNEYPGFVPPLMPPPFPPPPQPYVSQPPNYNNYNNYNGFSSQDCYAYSQDHLMRANQHDQYNTNNQYDAGAKNQGPGYIQNRW